MHHRPGTSLQVCELVPESLATNDCCQSMHLPEKRHGNQTRLPTCLSEP